MISFKTFFCAIAAPLVSSGANVKPELSPVAGEGIRFRFGFVHRTCGSLPLKCLSFGEKLMWRGGTFRFALLLGRRKRLHGSLHRAGKDENIYSSFSSPSASSRLLSLENNESRTWRNWDFSMDPDGEDARVLLMNKLGISESQHRKLSDLSRLVVDWNQRINLVSRKDCCVDVVFGRHVLPSLAMLKVPGSPLAQPQSGDDCGRQHRRIQVVDVGTGGGFPGLPLAVTCPHINFMLVDSVGKKLLAVEDIAKRLRLTNVSTHHGRAEEMAGDVVGAARSYDVCVGRSVASLPKFCFWVSDLIKKQTGSMFYIIGGDVDKLLVSGSGTAEHPLDDLLGWDGFSDKRVLVFEQQEVERIAAHSGEVKRKRGKRKARTRVSRTKRSVKGAWSSASYRESGKDLGKQDFQRYNF